MRKDGTKSGFDLELTEAISQATTVPIIASGGAGEISHFTEIFQIADAALAASIFHFGEIPIPELKRSLQTQNILIR
jgi:cyclase